MLLAVLEMAPRLRLNSWLFVDFNKKKLISRSRSFWISCAAEKVQIFLPGDLSLSCRAIVRLYSHMNNGSCKIIDLRPMGAFPLRAPNNHESKIQDINYIIIN